MKEVRLLSFTGLSLIVFNSWSLTEESPLQNNSVERGQWLSKKASCTACHTGKDGLEFGGGYEIQSPVRLFRTPNISSSKEYGIGTWSLEDFDGAIDVKAHGPAYGQTGGQFSCTKCHNGFEDKNLQTTSESWHFLGREVLNYRTNPTHIKARMVEMLEMPTYINELPFMKSYLNAPEAAKKDDVQDRIKNRSLTGINFQLQEVFSSGVESYLHNIKEEGAISGKTYHQAMLEVKDMKSIMKRVHHEMDKAYGRELRNWLLGLDRANCLNLIEGPKETK
jgi:hypothetical protein